MFGWLIFFKITISDFKLSRSLVFNRAVTISLMATSVPWTRCSPCHTVENDPAPSCCPTTYSPTTNLPPLLIGWGIDFTNLQSEYNSKTLSGSNWFHRQHPSTTATYWASIFTDFPARTNNLLTLPFSAFFFSFPSLRLLTVVLLTVYGWRTVICGRRWD